jgi:hypothetical protein
MAPMRYFVRPVKQRAWLPGQEPWRLGPRRAMRLAREKEQREKEAAERAAREEKERPFCELREQMRPVPSRATKPREP